MSMGRIFRTTTSRGPWNVVVDGDESESESESSDRDPSMAMTIVIGPS